MNFPGRLFFLLLGTLFASGCSSYTAHREPNRPLAEYRTYFVKSNFHDNHGIDIRLVRALQARGLEADKGPLTLLPRTAQVLVSYDDRWNWDFKNHMTYLIVTLQDARSEQPIASASFSGPAALTSSPDEIIDRLLNKLYSAPADKKKRGSP